MLLVAFAIFLVMLAGVESISKGMPHPVLLPVGSSFTVNCTVEDAKGVGATVWNGSPSIFDCSSQNSFSNNRISLIHFQYSQENPARGKCGSVTAHSVSWYTKNETKFTSALTIPETDLSMNGSVIGCSFVGQVLVFEVFLRIEG